MSWLGRSTGEPPRDLSIRRTWPVPFDPYFHEGLTLALLGWQLRIPPGREPDGGARVEAGQVRAERARLDQDATARCSLRRQVMGGSS